MPTASRSRATLSVVPSRPDFAAGAASLLSSKADRAWRDYADRAVAFRDTHGFWPRTVPATPAATDERVLGGWLKNQRKNAVPGSRDEKQLTKARRNYLDLIAPGWEDGTRDKWLGRAEQFSLFVHSSGHLPASTTSLGQWWANTRPALTDDGGWRLRWLDQHVPGWAEALTVQDAHLRDKAQQLIDFVTGNDRWPSAWGPTELERALGNFRAKQTQTVRAGNQNIATLLLDEGIPGWSDRGVPWRPFAEWLDEAVALYESTGRIPRMGRVGAWVGRYRAYLIEGSSRISADQKAQLDHRLPGWSQPARDADRAA